MRRSIETQVRATYFSLRIGVAVIAIAFPLLLWIGGKFAGIRLRGSMSAYYHATANMPLPCAAKHPDITGAETREAGSMRNWFVGLLFAVGTALYVNKGYSARENIALNVAGILAVGIAVFPMTWTCGADPPFTMHGTCAVLFFLSIAYVSAFCSEDTLLLIEPKDRRQWYRRIYRTLAWCMIVSPALAYTFNVVTHQDSFVYWAEVFGIYSFAAYWLVKSKEIAEIGAEKKAVEGTGH